MRRTLLGLAAVAAVLVGAALFSLQSAGASDLGSTALFDRVTCASTATAFPLYGGVSQIAVKTTASGLTIFIGDASVTADANYPSLAGGEGVTLNVTTTGRLYCRTASGSQVAAIVIEK